MAKCGTYSGYITHIKNKTKICKECRSASNKYRREKRTLDNKKLGYDPRRFKRHRITKEYYELLLFKNNKKCWICNENDGVHIDHDHSCCSKAWSCGKCIRGILCSNCNTAIGLMNDDVKKLKNAIKYLS